MEEVIGMKEKKHLILQVPVTPPPSSSSTPVFLLMKDSGVTVVGLGSGALRFKSSPRHSACWVGDVISVTFCQINLPLGVTERINRRSGQACIMLMSACEYVGVPANKKQMDEMRAVFSQTY